MTAHALPEVTEAVSRAGRADPALLDALPQPPHGRTRRADRRRFPASRTPGCSSPPRAPRPTTPRCCWPPRYRRSNQILAMRNSYHGRSFSTVADHRQLRLVAHDVSRRCRRSTCMAASAAGARSHASTTRSSPRRVSRTWGPARPGRRHRAALIAEPIQGVGGFTMPPDGLFAASATCCAEQGILWITDEVQTGWGRTGEHFWGWQAHGRADRRTSSRSPRASATACPSAAWSPAPRS